MPAPEGAEIPVRSSVRPPLVACVPLLLALFAAAGPVAEANAQNLGPEDGRELPPADLKRVAVGSKAPNFTLASYGGAPVELAGYRGRKFVVLVFYRGHW